MARSSSSLAIVEKGFRGALEEQYGNIVWLSECMRAMKADHNLLLKGQAVAMCFKQQQQTQVDIGDISIAQMSHFARSIEALIDRGARIWVLTQDLSLFDPRYELVERVEVADSMAQLCMKHDKVWFW